MLEFYLNSFAKLKVSRDKIWGEDLRNGAPYKPILLLSVLNLIEQGEITSNFVELTPELSEMFAQYCSKVSPLAKKSKIFLPFYHLKSDKFWHLEPNHGYEEIVKHGNSVGSASQLRRIAMGAKLDDELYQLFCIEDSRNKLRKILIETYFSTKIQLKLLKLQQDSIETANYSKSLLTNIDKTFKIKESSENYQSETPKVRDQGFRRTIVKAYNHRCAVCGVRVVTAEGHTAVAGAHIVPWSYSHNDDPRNGLALCGLCHWAFDEGIVTILSNYTVKLSNQLSLEFNAGGHLTTLAERHIFTPVDQNLAPAIVALEWHSKNIFKKV